uniref:Surface-adhesin protein E-like domain-containing protein n=1 Tax=Geobacter sp. (strain M21) TaxID=443144 RepID=C6E3D7_GEOSM
MKKKVFAMTAMVVMSAYPASGQQWEHLGTHGASAYYYYNPKTLNVSKDQIVKTWTKKELDTDLPAMSKAKIEVNKYKGNRSLVAYEEYDCAGKAKRTVTGTSYDNEKGVSQDLGPTPWQEVVGGTLEGDLFEAVCRKAGKR